MTAFYNEIDPYAAQWLRNLIDAGHIAPGVVDERSIEDIAPNELVGYTQCHFFAGIGGWSLALRLAGWPRDRPVWTGSCPCQPFSAAGKGAGFEDERHLWPAWQHLIAQCGPPVVFGEQVASKAAEPWIDLVHADVEGLGYAFGCVPYPAAGIGAPHIRDRNYWVAHAANGGWGEERSHAGRHIAGDRAKGLSAGFMHGIGTGGMADTDGGDSSAEREQRGGEHGLQPKDSRVVRMADAKDIRHERDGEFSESSGRHGTSHGCAGSELGVGLRLRESKSGKRCGLGEQRVPGAQHFPESTDPYRNPGPTNGLWRAADWLLCTDGKWRPVESGTFPLAHGVSGRVGRLRAYGNAIVPQQAAEFIQAYCEAVGINLGLTEQAA